MKSKSNKIIKIEKAGKKEQNDIMRTVWIPEYSQCNGTFADENNMMILTLNVSQEPSYFRPTSLKTIVKRLEKAFNGKNRLLQSHRCVLLPQYYFRWLHYERYDTK